MFMDSFGTLLSIGIGLLINYVLFCIWFKKKVFGFEFTPLRELLPKPKKKPSRLKLFFVYGYIVALAVLVFWFLWPFFRDKL